MRLIRSSIISTDTLGQLFSGKQAIGLDDVPLAVDPFGLNRVEPGALRRQQEGQDTHACARLLDLLIVLANPGANGLTLMPGGVIPDQEPVGFALLEQPLAAPVQELRGDRAHRSSADKTQPHLLTFGFLWGPFLPQYAIAGQRLRVRITLLPGLFHQTDGVLWVLPGVQTRQSKTTPPPLILEADGPARLLAGPGDQPVACVFLKKSVKKQDLVHFCPGRWRCGPCAGGWSPGSCCGESFERGQSSPHHLFSSACLISLGRERGSSSMAHSDWCSFPFFVIGPIAWIARLIEARLTCMPCSASHHWQ